MPVRIFILIIHHVYPNLKDASAIEDYYHYSWFLLGTVSGNTSVYFALLFSLIEKK